MSKFDLRGFNIKDDEDAMAFLDLIEKKLPQLKAYLKNSRVKRQSLLDRAQFAEKQNGLAQSQPDEANIQSVGDRLAGELPQTAQQENKELSRLEQMRQAGAEKTSEAAPGEVGTLHHADSEQGNASADFNTSDEVQAGVPSASAPDAGTDQPEPKAEGESESTSVTDEDTTSVGDRVVKKTAAKKPAAKKK